MAVAKIVQKYKGRPRLMLRDLIDSLNSVILYDSTHPWKNLLTDLGGGVAVAALLGNAKTALTLTSTRGS